MELKKWFWWLVLNFGFAAAVWFGFVEGVQGAQYLAKFWIWAVPMGLMAFTDSMRGSTAFGPGSDTGRSANGTTQAETLNTNDRRCRQTRMAAGPNLNYTAPAA